MPWPVGLLLPAAAAGALAWRGRRRGGAAILPVAAGLMIGATSVPWAILFFAGIRSRPLLLAADAVFWVTVTAAIAVRGAEAPRARAIPERIPAAVTIAAALVATFLLATAVWAFSATSAVLPHGEWDAWAQWNLRARFFFRGLADGTWMNAFAPVLAWSHADYPPLVPVSVARLWLFGGRETVFAPITLAAVFTAAIVLGTGASVWRARGAARGCLSASVLLACPSLIRWAPSQCADVPLAFFMLAAFVSWHDERPVLAGLSAALAAWTKNEGLLFLAIFAAVFTAARLWSGGTRARRDVLMMLAGGFPVLLTVLWYKHALAPPSYFVGEQTLAQALARLHDMDRLALISRTLGRELWLTGATLVGVVPFLAAFAVIRGLRRNAPAPSKWAMVAMAAMLAGYAVAYLISPKDLAWQLQTSADRVVLQLVPTLVWSVLSSTA